MIYPSADLEEAKITKNANYFKLRPDFDLMNFCGSTSKIGLLPMPFWESMNELIRINAKGITYRNTLRNPYMIARRKRKKNIVRVAKKKKRKTSVSRTNPSILLFTSSWN